MTSLNLFIHIHNLLKRESQILPLAPVTAMGAGRDDPVLGLRITKTCVPVQTDKKW